MTLTTYHIVFFCSYVFLPFPLLGSEVMGVSYWFSILLSPQSIASLFSSLQIAILFEKLTICMCKTLISQHPLNTYLQSVCYVPGTVLGTRETLVHKTKSLYLENFHFSEETDKKMKHKKGGSKCYEEK